MPPTPRVRCGGCAFQWFSATLAHGLRIVGSCPRCGGALEFLVAVEEPDEPPASAEADRRLDALGPAAVLGRPSDWGAMR